MTVIAELRRAVRSLGRQPWFTLAAIASLAFGIGANVTVFTLVNALLFRPLPYRESDRLVFVRSENQRLGVARGAVSLAELDAIRAGARSLRGAGVVREGDFNITLGDGSRRIRGAIVSAATLSTLGVVPQLGGAFTPDDDRPTAPARALVSDGLWRSALGARTDIDGATLRVDGTVFQIAGVLPPGFRFPEQAEVWIPVGAAATSGARVLERSARVYQLVARLSPAASLAAARRELANVSRALDDQRAAPERGWTLAAISAESERGENARPSVYLLFALVTCVLLVACANLASLVMVRAMARRRELAIRSALGASEGRLVWHGLSESAILVVAGAALAVGIALAGVGAVRLVFPAGTLPFWLHFDVDWRVLMYTLGISVATALTFGLVPAVLAARRAPAAGLVSGSRFATPGAERGRIGGFLVAGQVAAALVLVVAASLLGAALRSMRSTDLGYDPRGLLTTDVEPHGRRYAADAVRGGYYASLTESIRGIPGVRAVTGFDLWGGAPIDIARGAGAPLQRVASPIYSVLPDYFETIGARVLAGRSVGGNEPGATPIAVVNETFARRFWPNEHAIGQRIRLGTRQRDTVWLTVSGVVSDVRRNPADLEWEPHVYIAALRFPPRRLQLVVRVGDSAIPPRAFSDAARAVDPDEPLGPMMTMEQQIGVWMAPSRFFAVAIAAFAIVTMLLAAAGVYGVVAGGMVARTRELGIRIALGAAPAQVVSIAMRRGARLSATGAVVGITLAIAVSRVLVSLPFGVERVDARIVAVAALGLVMIAMLAAYGPARRAGRVEPTVVLSDDV